MVEINQFQWRGRLLNTRRDSSGHKYVAMSGSKSLLYASFPSPAPDTTYKITLELRAENGNGVGYCNVYGNRKFDFPQVQFTCEKGGWQTYDIEICTKSFPNTVPLVFRIWRSPAGTGTLCVKKIVINPLTKPAPTETPKLISKEEALNKTVEEREEPRKIAPPLRVLPGKTPEVLKGRPGERIPPPKKRREKRRRRGKRKSFHSEPQPSPKVLPVVIGESGIKVSVIISVFNRESFFERSLYLWSRQTLPKNEFELIVVDDKSIHDIKGLCKKYAENTGLQFQYILVDRFKGAIEPKGWTPALSNNIGLKLARGSVIVITGPETLQKETNLELSWACANEGKCIYGNVYRSNLAFVEAIKDNWKISFDDFLKISGSKADTSVITGWWWYYMSIRKEHLLAINGVDEKYMLGIAAEDDNIALRIKASGVPLVREPNIEGIHQDHSKEDREDKHSFRFDKRKWNELRKINVEMLKAWEKSREPVANRGIDWGSEKAIIEKEIF